MFRQLRFPLLAMLLLMAASANAQVTVSMYEVSADGVGKALGSVTLADSNHGLVVTPALHGVAPGLHGFHVHENGSCEPSEKDGKMVAGMAAGGHYDPDDSGHHGLPWGDGHRGDLPALYVDSKGNATHPVLAPRLKLAELDDRALMIHVGGDNYSDDPAPLGGGGARMACGVISLGGN